MHATSSYSISRAAYYFDWALVCAAEAIVLVLVARYGVVAEWFASALIAGGLAWSLVEYLVHRFVLHGDNWLGRQHAIHHREPAEFIGVHPRATVPLFVLVGFGSVWLLGWSIGLGFFAGFVAWYFAYIALHDWYHHGDANGALAQHHNGHHRRGRSNFGVSSPLWDHVFRTAQ